MEKLSGTDSFRFIILGIYGIAMGIFEAVLVIYLRLIYYPEGFGFPLPAVKPLLLKFELAREAATIIMIAAVAIIAAGEKLKRFAWFLYIFAVWDIFYYIFLKLLLDWPESLLAWDVLFLIPVTWFGPVLAPLICSVTMIIMAGVLIIPGGAGLRVRPAVSHWVLIISGAVVIFVSFVKEYSLLIIEGGFLPNYFRLYRSEEFMAAASRFVPESFDWHLFLAGEALILIALGLIIRRTAGAEIIRQQ